MNIVQCEGWARWLRNTAWYDDLRALGQSLRTPRRDSSRLLVVGHPEHEPWHLAAHLEMLADFRGLPELRPSLVRGIEIGAQSNDAILVVSEHPVPACVLDRLDDARSRGATVLGLSTEDPDLAALAHQAVTLDLDRLELGGTGLVADFDLASHLLGVAAAAPKRFRLAGRLRRSG